MSNPLEHIDDYINNSLGPSDKIAFEDAMKSDESLRFAVDEYESLRIIALSTIDEEVNTAFGQQQPSQIKTISKPRYKNLLIAASFAGLAVASWGIIKYQNHQAYLDRVEMAMADYVPPQVVFTRSGEGNNSTAMDKVKDAFSKRDYDQCILFLKDISNDKQDDEYHWLKGHTLFIKRDFKNANEQFSKISSAFHLSDDAKRMQKIITDLVSKQNQ